MTRRGSGAGVEPEGGDAVEGRVGAADGVFAAGGGVARDWAGTGGDSDGAWHAVGEGEIGAGGGGLCCAAGAAVSREAT